MSKILIVEDNPDNSVLATKILAHFGFEIVVCENGKETINWCKYNKCDLVYMDISLPDMTGFDVTKEIKKIDNYKNIPIIALTAHAFDSEKEVAEKAGMSDYLTKPFLPNQIVEMTRKYL